MRTREDVAREDNDKARVREDNDKARDREDKAVTVNELTQSLQHKYEFINLISHEMRTPLKAIIKISKAVVNSNDDTSVKRVWMNTIMQSAIHLMGIINDMISLKTVNVHLEYGPVNLESVIDGVMTTLAPTRTLRTHIEKIVVVDNVMPLVCCDKRRIAQCLSNIIGNAIKFTSKGFIKIKLSFKGEDAVIEVVDSGCGIPADMLDEVIEPFTQVYPSTTTRRYAGAGLGLPIAVQIVKAHDGNVRIESQVGEGTRVRIAIPIERKLGDADTKVVDAVHNSMSDYNNTGSDASAASGDSDMPPIALAFTSTLFDTIIPRNSSNPQTSIDSSNPQTSIDSSQPQTSFDQKRPPRQPYDNVQTATNTRWVTELPKRRSPIDYCDAQPPPRQSISLPTVIDDTPQTAAAAAAAAAAARGSRRASQPLPDSDVTRRGVAGVERAGLLRNIKLAEMFGIKKRNVKNFRI